MGQLQANIKTISELDFSLFDIPFYQRPYRWQPSHVETLLNCILESQNNKKEEYRIGSIIIHRSAGSEKMEVVDGQQRLTTLSLLFMCIDENTTFTLECEFRNEESCQNIYRNYRHIKRWLEYKGIDTEAMKNYILTKCSVVIIETDNLSEAFQMFDSQNGRGKELEAYNLLKAYHIRAIDNEHNRISVTDEKIAIDRQWEQSVLMKSYGSDSSLLKTIINELFRIRQWSKAKRGYSFGKSKIKEFKGIQFSEGFSPLPLHNQSFLLYLTFRSSHNAIKDGFAKRRLYNGQLQNPLVSINMDIINGSLFFSYVNTYVDSYNYLFKTEFQKEDTLFQFKRDFEEFCINYGGAYRTGDSYIRAVYMALVIALYDRFGETCVGRYYKTLYNLAFRKRLESLAVFYDTVSQYPIPYFEAIANAIDENGLESLRIYASKDIDGRKLGKNELAIAEFIVRNTPTVIVCNTSNVTVQGKILQLGETINKSSFSNGAE